MSFERVINFIKNLNQSDLILTYHARLRFLQRNLTVDDIFHVIKNNLIFGIHNQNNKVYKLWLWYNNQEDLTLIFKLKNNKLNIITVIKEDIKKRLKNEK